MPRIRIAAVAATIVALAAPAAASAQTPAVSKPQLPASAQVQDIQQLMMALAQQRTAMLEQVTKTQVGTIQANNQKLVALQQELAKTGSNPVANAAQIAAIKQQIAALNNTAQLDMIKLQSMVGKQNQALEMMSNLLQKLAATKDAIIGNIR